MKCTLKTLTAAAAIALLPVFAFAADGDPKDGTAVLVIAFLVVVFAIAFMVWHLKDWIEAKADEAKERARSMKLDNDRKELENKAKARDLNVSPSVGE